MGSIGSVRLEPQLSDSSLLSCTSTPSRRLDLTLATLLLADYVDRNQLSESSSRKLFFPSAFPDTRTHLVTVRLLPSPPGNFYPSSQVSLSRVWLPSQSVSRLFLIPLRASFSPQRSWDSPFKAFLLQGDLERFPFLLSTLAILYKTIPALYRRFSGLSPP